MCPQFIFSKIWYLYVCYVQMYVQSLFDHTKLTLLYKRRICQSSLVIGLGIRFRLQNSSSEFPNHLAPKNPASPSVHLHLRFLDILCFCFTPPSPNDAVKRIRFCPWNLIKSTLSCLGPQDIESADSSEHWPCDECWRVSSTTLPCIPIGGVFCPISDVGNSQLIRATGSGGREEGARHVEAQGFGDGGERGRGQAGGHTSRSRKRGRAFVCVHDLQGQDGHGMDTQTSVITIFALGRSLNVWSVRFSQ